ncbi:hypothetical protein M9H77_11870 [Catharanthus roseus]|uniref:Uncharacterized protein n=1 Tax=Catharanthus roseus TaxID=4058 RepID=A0ACC0BFQ8_CATRO|nr:hypothetical protein M9H77_11870 [Catharanthus roseus]
MEKRQDDLPSFEEPLRLQLKWKNVREMSAYQRIKNKFEEGEPEKENENFVDTHGGHKEGRQETEIDYIEESEGSNLHIEDNVSLSVGLEWRTQSNIPCGNYSQYSTYDDAPPVHLSPPRPNLEDLLSKYINSMNARVKRMEAVLRIQTSSFRDMENLIELIAKRIVEEPLSHIPSNTVTLQGVEEQVPSKRENDKRKRKRSENDKNRADGINEADLPPEVGQPTTDGRSQSNK